jgi:hypothetical protein
MPPFFPNVNISLSDRDWQEGNPSQWVLHQLLWSSTQLQHILVSFQRHIEMMALHASVLSQSQHLCWKKLLAKVNFISVSTQPILMISYTILQSTLVLFQGSDEVTALCPSSLHNNNIFVWWRDWQVVLPQFSSEPFRTGTPLTRSIRKYYIYIMSNSGYFYYLYSFPPRLLSSDEGAGFLWIWVGLEPPILLPWPFLNNQAPTNSPVRNCLQDGLWVLVGNDEQHHTDTNSWPNRQQWQTMQGPGSGPHNDEHWHPHNSARTSTWQWQKGTQQRRTMNGDWQGLSNNLNDWAAVPSLASHCSQGGSWDELRGWKHLKICPYSYPIEFIPGDDFHLLNGVFHTVRLLPIMGLFSSHQGQKTLSSWIPPEWKNGNYSSTSCSFIISFILLVVNFQTVCYTMCILVLPQLRLQASSSHSRAGFEPELSWVRSDQSCSSARPAVAAVLAQELTWESKLCVVVFSDIWPVTTLITYFSNQLENTGFKGERTERCTALIC